MHLTITDTRKTHREITPHLGVCVEQFKQGHDQLLHPYVSVPVLLHVVAHGLPLCLRQQVAGLLLQHGSALVHQAGQGHLGARHALIEHRLEGEGGEEEGQKKDTVREKVCVCVGVGG
jgi:hypothetical protein